MNIKNWIFPQATNDQEKMVFKILDEVLRSIKSVLNGGIRFEDNFDNRLLTFTSNATPDTETVVAHTLGKIPVGIIVYSQNKAGSLYNSNNDHTTTAIKIKCSVASVTFKVIIF